MATLTVLPVALHTKVECIKEHPDGDFTERQIYKVSSYRLLDKSFGVRIRDNRRQRKDFNFIPTSKNYFWDYFKIQGE